MSDEGKPDIIRVAPQGDLVLRIEHASRTTKGIHAFRVDSSTLKATSKYFDSLLRGGRFSEASDVETAHLQLQQQYGDVSKAPSCELPLLNIHDVGRISAVKAIDSLMTDFLSILHGHLIEAVPPVSNLANLAVVADRFDALEVVKSYVRRKKMIRSIDGKTTPKIDTGLSEDKVRQRLLIALMFDYGPWLEKYSARLVTKGWAGREVDFTSALWWDLPSRVEEELAYRRECILDTIQSVQTHFLTIYTSRDTNCRLGYDNSAQCDHFQLGEMIRFFTRIGTLRLRGAILETDETPPPYAGDVYTLLDTMRQAPEYQIDRFHTHCGIRTTMLPILGLLEECLQHIGICPECWQVDRSGYAWMEQKRPLVWKRQDFRVKAQGHGNRHAGIRAVFTATERHWS